MREYKFTNSDQTVNILIMSDSEEVATSILLETVLEPLDYILDEYSI